MNDTDETEDNDLPMDWEPNYDAPRRCNVTSGGFNARDEWGNPDTAVGMVGR